MLGMILLQKSSQAVAQAAQGGVSVDVALRGMG